MEIIIGIVLLAIGALCGYAYFRNKYKSEHFLADTDFIECQTDATGRPVSGKDHAACYIDKKSKKIRQHLDIAD